jgi:hypothetical protein
LNCGTIEKFDDEQTGLSSIMTVKLDSCGLWSNDVGFLTFLVKRIHLSVLYIILTFTLRALKLIKSMDCEFKYIILTFTFVTIH